MEESPQGWKRLQFEANQRRCIHTLKRFLSLERWTQHFLHGADNCAIKFKLRTYLYQANRKRVCSLSVLIPGGDRSEVSPPMLSKVFPITMMNFHSPYCEQKHIYRLPSSVLVLLFNGRVLVRKTSATHHTIPALWSVWWCREAVTLWNLTVGSTVGSYLARLALHRSTA